MYIPRSMLVRGRAAHNYRKKTPFLLFCCSKVLTQSHHCFLDSFLVILVFGILISKMEIISNPGHSIVLNFKWKIKYLEHSLDNSKGPGNILLLILLLFLLFLSLLLLLVAPKIYQPHSWHGDILKGWNDIQAQHPSIIRHSMGVVCFCFFLVMF